ncbi:MAG: ogr/Delta-like zinc finger family protein [Aliivibrio sp.]|nr:ogr/Delta-like zinc finger family protein [Aliivibrio sp.]
MRVFCKCGERAVISRSTILEDGGELSCSCRDADCGHSFITAINYKHALCNSTINITVGASMAGNKIHCGCGERAVIKKTNRLSNDCADLYCECKNRECGHNFVMSLYFSHTLSPSAKSTENLAIHLIRVLSPQGRTSLKQQLALF